MGNCPENCSSENSNWWDSENGKSHDQKVKPIPKMDSLKNNSVRVAENRKFSSGSPISIDDVDYFWVNWQRLQKKSGIGCNAWVNDERNAGGRKLLLCYWPVTREFTEDNVTMSLKAAEKALKMANIQAGEIEFIAYGSAHQNQMPTSSVRIQEALG